MARVAPAPSPVSSVDHAHRLMFPYLVIVRRPSSRCLPSCAGKAEGPCGCSRENVELKYKLLNSNARGPAVPGWVKARWRRAGFGVVFQLCLTPKP